MMQQDKPFSLRDFMWGAMIMLVILTFANRMSPEHKNYQEIKELKTECERNLPRSENCVIVALPKSKD